MESGRIQFSCSSFPDSSLRCRQSRWGNLPPCVLYLDLCDNFAPVCLVSHLSFHFRFPPFLLVWFFPPLWLCAPHWLPSPVVCLCVYLGSVFPPSSCLPPCTVSLPFVSTSLLVIIVTDLRLFTLRPASAWSLFVSFTSADWLHASRPLCIAWSLPGLFTSADCYTCTELFVLPAPCRNCLDWSSVLVGAFYKTIAWPTSCVCRTIESKPLLCLPWSRYCELMCLTVNTADRHQGNLFLVLQNIGHIKHLLYFLIKFNKVKSCSRGQALQTHIGNTAQHSPAVQLGYIVL